MSVEKYTFRPVLQTDMNINDKEKEMAYRQFSP